MIYAVRHNKINRTLFKGNEDSLTATVFERLFYLPKELFHKIFVNSLYDTIEGVRFDLIEEIEFWPSWDAENTSNVNRVEPDVFMRSATHDIIIEAKRYNSEQQNMSQWKNQLRAYNNEYSEDGKSLIYIALGGLRSQDTGEIKLDEDKHYCVYKSDWSGLLKAIKEIFYELEDGQGLLNSTDAAMRVLKDLIMCFGMYGFSTAEWFDRFYRPINISEKNIQTIATWKK